MTGTGKKRARGEQSATAALAGHQGFSLISNEKLRELYAAMLGLRLKAESGGRASGQARAAKAVRGHEAAVVASTIDLGAGDAVFSVGLGRLSGRLPGLADGVRQNEPDVTGVEPELAATLAAASAMALEEKSRRASRVVVLVAAGLPKPGARTETARAWREGLARVAVHQLPMLILCCGGDPEREAREPEGAAEQSQIKSQIEAPQLPAIAVDGADVVGIYRVTTEMMAQARRGRGPTLIDCCRLSADGAVAAPGARATVDEAALADPIAQMERYLAARALFTEEWKRELAARLRAD